VQTPHADGTAHPVDLHHVVADRDRRPIGVVVLVEIFVLLPDRAICHLDECLTLPAFPGSIHCVSHDHIIAQSTDTLRRVPDLQLVLHATPLWQEVRRT